MPKQRSQGQVDPRSVMVRESTQPKRQSSSSTRDPAQDKRQRAIEENICYPPSAFAVHTWVHSQDHVIHHIQIQREATDKYEIQTTRKIEARCSFKQEALPGGTRGGKGDVTANHYEMRS